MMRNVVVAAVSVCYCVRNQSCLSEPAKGANHESKDGTWVCVGGRDGEGRKAGGEEVDRGQQLM